MGLFYEQKRHLDHFKGTDFLVLTIVKEFDIQEKCVLNSNIHKKIVMHLNNAKQIPRQQKNPNLFVDLCFGISSSQIAKNKKEHRKTY